MFIGIQRTQIKAAPAFAGKRGPAKPPKLPEEDRKKAVKLFEKIIAPNGDEQLVMFPIEESGVMLSVLASYVAKKKKKTEKKAQLTLILAPHKKADATPPQAITGLGNLQLIIEPEKGTVRFANDDDNERTKAQKKELLKLASTFLDFARSWLKIQKLKAQAPEN